MTTDRKSAWVLVLLLALATLGRGGADARVLLAWHLGVCGLLLVALVAPDGPAKPRTLARLPLLGFLSFFAVAAAGAARAPYGYAAWLFLLELGAFLAVAWLAARPRAGWLERLRGPLLWIATFQSVVFLVQRFALGELRPAATMLNPNHLAAWLVAVLFFVLGDWLVGAPASRRPVPLEWGCLAPIALALALIGSRGAIVGLIAGTTVIFVRGWQVWSPRGRQALVAVAVVGLLIAGVGIATRLGQFDPFRYQRIRIWSAASNVVVDDPWFGSGPRQFAYAARDHQFPDGDGPLRYDRGFRTTHSDWLRVPVELGWPGAFLLLLTVMAVVRQLYLSPTRGAPGVVSAAAALTALAAQASVENLSTRPAIYLLVAVLLGGLLSVESRREHRMPFAARLLLGLGVIGVVALGDVSPYLAWRQTRDLPQEDRQPADASRLRRALRRNPVHPDYWRRLSSHLSSPGGPWNLETYAAAREAAERAIRLNPAAAEGQRQLGRVEARACSSLFPDEGTRSRATRAYRTAEQLDRFNPFIPLELAGFLLDSGDPSGADRAARRALALEPESVRPRLVLAAAVLESNGVGARDEADQMLREARDGAARWSDWADQSDYARELLTLDPHDVARLERRLQSTTSPVTEQGIR